MILISSLAYYNDIVVGGVCCRIETEGTQRRIYIMTLGCLAPYRRLGVGTYNYLPNSGEQIEINCALGK